MARIGVCSLEREGCGLTLVVKINQFKYTIHEVPENIIRCALGEDDMSYLLGEQPNPEYEENEFSDIEDEFISPSRDESHCFSLSPNEFKECMRHGQPLRDMNGSVMADWAYF